MPVKIFVGNLSEDTRSTDLKPLFEKYGKVMQCDVLNRFGFVHMDDDHEAKNAINGLHGLIIHGSKINVEISHGRKGFSNGRGPYRGGFRGGRGPRVEMPYTPDYYAMPPASYPLYPHEYMDGGDPYIRDPYSRYAPPPPRVDPYDRYSRYSDYYDYPRIERRRPYPDPYDRYASDDRYERRTTVRPPSPPDYHPSSSSSTAAYRPPPEYYDRRRPTPSDYASDSYPSSRSGASSSRHDYHSSRDSGRDSGRSSARDGARDSGRDSARVSSRDSGRDYRRY